MIERHKQIPLELQKKIVDLVDKQSPKINLSKQETETLIIKIKKLLQEQNAKLIAHFYVDKSLQILTEETGGFVGDSLEMARFGKQSDSDIIMVAGVKFMGETAKILSPEKQVLMPTLEAECSLDLSCPPDEFAKFIASYPGREVVVYANTSATIKAMADWVVTSSNAIQIVRHLHKQRKKILWAPDYHLGKWIENHTKADMIIWEGDCVVHNEFNIHQIKVLLAEEKNAILLAHPESPKEVTDLAQVVGSTKILVEAVKTLPNKKFIVATDQGIFYKMQQARTDADFLIAPTYDKNTKCLACANCPWMAQNNLVNLYNSLKMKNNNIELDKKIIEQARIPIMKMLKFRPDFGLS